MRSGQVINVDWFKLYSSRGLDTIELKTFMRATALVSEFLIYVPAVVIFVRVFGRQADLSKYDKVWRCFSLGEFAEDRRLMESGCGACCDSNATGTDDH
jgi:hypothetical protein